jgi:uncharacterized membrane protein YeaQ/YmgE (transglycosylase-associated protein family)
MSLLLYVAIGLFIGWISAAVAEVDEGIFARMGIGVLGAFLGVALSTLFIYGETMTHLSPITVGSSIVCSVLLINLLTTSLSRSREKPSRDRKTA